MAGGGSRAGDPRCVARPSGQPDGDHGGNDSDRLGDEQADGAANRAHKARALDPSRWPPHTA